MEDPNETGAEYGSDATDDEVRVWVGEKEKSVKGLTEETTCLDVIHSLLKHEKIANVKTLQQHSIFQKWPEYSRQLHSSVKILHEFKKCQAKGVTFHLQKTTAVQNYSTSASNNNNGNGGTLSKANTSSTSHTNTRNIYQPTELKSSSGDQKDDKRSRSRANSSNRYSQFDTLNPDDPNVTSPGTASKSETLSTTEQSASTGVHADMTSLVQEGDQDVRGRKKEKRRRSKRRRGMSLDNNSLLLIQHMNDKETIQTHRQDSVDFPYNNPKSTDKEFAMKTSPTKPEDDDYSFRDLISQISSRHANQTTSSNDPETVQDGHERYKTYKPVLRKVSVKRDDSRKQRTRVYSADDLLDCFVREAIRDSELQNQFPWRNPKPTQSSTKVPESHKTTIDNNSPSSVGNDSDNRKERRYQKAQQDPRSPSSNRRFAVNGQNRSKTPTITSDQRQLNPMVSICRELKEFNARYYDSKLESNEAMKDVRRTSNNSSRSNESKNGTNNEPQNTQELMMQEKKVATNSPKSNETMANERGNSETIRVIEGSDRLWMKGGNRREQQTQSTHKQSPQHAQEQPSHVPRQSTHYYTEKESNEFESCSITDINTCYTDNNIISSGGINKSSSHNINANNSSSTGNKRSNINNSYTPNHHLTHHHHQSQQNTSPQFIAKPSSHLLPEKSTNKLQQRIYTQGQQNQQPRQNQQGATVKAYEQAQSEEPHQPSLPDEFGNAYWNDSTPIAARKQSLPYQKATNASCADGTTAIQPENIYRANRVSSPKLQTTRRRKNSLLQAKKQKELQQKCIEEQQNQVQQIQLGVSNSADSKIPSPPARIVQHHYQKYFDSPQDQQNYPKTTSQEPEQTRRTKDISSFEDAEADNQERDRCRENIGMQCAELSTLHDRIDTVEQQIVQLLLLNNSDNNRTNNTDVNTFGTEQSILCKQKQHDSAQVDSLRDNFAAKQYGYDSTRIPAPLVTSELEKALGKATSRGNYQSQFTIQHEIKTYYERIQQTTDQLASQKLAQSKLQTVIESLKARKKLENQHKSTTAPTPVTCPKCQIVFRYPKPGQGNDRKCLCTLQEELEHSKAKSEAIAKESDETEAHISKVEQDIIEHKMRIQRLEYEIDYCYKQKSIQSEHRSPEKPTSSNSKSSTSQYYSQYQPHSKVNSSHYQHRPSRVPLGNNNGDSNTVKNNNYQPLIPSHLATETKQSNRPTSPRKSAKYASNTTSNTVKTISDELSRANLTLTPPHLYLKNQRIQPSSTTIGSNQENQKARRRRVETDSDTGVGSMSTEEESSHLSNNQLTIASAAAQIAI